MDGTELLKAVQELTGRLEDNMQEIMERQVGSLVSRMEANQETMVRMEAKMEAAVHSMRAKRDCGLPRNDGGKSGVQGANVEGNVFRSGASAGPEGTCHSEFFGNNKEAAQGQESCPRAPPEVARKKGPV
jgi:hypothetical protein